MKKSAILMMRKCFYVLDMVLLGLLFFSFEHTLFRENPVVDHMLDVALILRITIPFHIVWCCSIFWNSPKYHNEYGGFPIRCF